MIEITIDNAASFLATVEASGRNLHLSMQNCMQRIGIMLQRYIVTQKLSGQVLQRRSGKLANSVNQRVLDDGQVVTAEVSAGSIAPYARVHEYGGAIQIPDHMSMSRLVNAFMVKAHSATYPERSFMRSSLAENHDQFVEMIDRAIAEGVK